MILANIYPGNDYNHIIFVVHEGKWLELPFGKCNAVIRLSRPFSPLFSQRVDKYSWRCTWFERFNSAINVLWVLPLRNILTRLEVVKHWVMLPFWGWGQFQREEFYIGDISLILPPSSIGSSQLSFYFFPSPPHLYKFDKFYYQSPSSSELPASKTEKTS